MLYWMAMIIVESGQILKNTYISAKVFGLLRLSSACKRIRYDYYRDPITQRFLCACKQDLCEVFQPKRSHIFWRKVALFG